MINNTTRLKIDTDDDFNSIYPLDIQNNSDRHWTPVDVAKTASNYLVQKANCRVLDIGSGVGKFCMVGASHTKGIFHGVEQRRWMVDLSNELAWFYKMENVKYFNMNMLNFPIKEYSSFYFFNSFHENIDRSALIDNTIGASESHYKKYSSYLFDQLQLTRKGSLLATFWVRAEKIPTCFIQNDSFYGGKLILWEKKW